MIPRRRMPLGDPAKPAKVVSRHADFKLFFDEFVKSQQKQWKHDRSKTMGGSEIFGCIRKAWYAKHNTPKDADYKESWGATRRGDLIENYHVVPAMVMAAENHGFKIDYVGAEQQTIFSVDSPISVTPDGLIHGLPRDWLKSYGVPDIQSDCVVFEIKSIDPRVDLSEEKAIHHGQVQTQMGIIRETSDFRPSFAVILYVDASFFDDMNVFIVEFDEKKWRAAKIRAERAMNAEDPSKLIREGVIDNSCQYCPFKGSCLTTTVAAMPPEGPKPKKGDQTSPKLIADLETLMEQMREAKFALKKAEKHDKLLKEQVKEVLRSHKQRRAKDSHWSVSYFMVQGRESLDRESLTTALGAVQNLIDEYDLGAELDKILKDQGIGEEGQNEARQLTVEAFMKRGEPYENMKLSYTEPDTADL